MSANSMFPIDADEPSEPDWDEVTAMLTQMRDYLTDADWDGALESVALINMLLDALDQRHSPEELVCHLLQGIRELSSWWGCLDLPGNLRVPVDAIRDALRDSDRLEVATFH